MRERATTAPGGGRFDGAGGRDSSYAEGIGAATAAIVQRISGAPEPPEPMTDEALAGLGRVVLAITVERVGAASYRPDEAVTASAA